MELKNGLYVDDLRTDRIIQFDENSKKYPVIHTLTYKQKTRAATGKTISWGCKPHLNQGSQGACVGFAITHEFLARPQAAKNLKADFARRLYRKAQLIDRWPGQAYAGTSVLAGAKIAKQLGWITGYTWAFGLNDLILGMATGPAVLGISWYNSMNSPNKKGFVRPIGSPSGGHSLLCKGINYNKQTFTLHNSWGNKWGRNGDCFITFSDMAKLLANDGEVCFFVGRSTKGRYK